MCNPQTDRTENADSLSSRGLDNAGKTTIVKKIMNEDVTTVSPTLGFIIKTIDFSGCVYLFYLFFTLFIIYCVVLY